MESILPTHELLFLEIERKTHTFVILCFLSRAYFPHTPHLGFTWYTTIYFSPQPHKQIDPQITDHN